MQFFWNLHYLFEKRQKEMNEALKDFNENHKK